MAAINGRPIIFGEVLFDCFPDDNNVLGGAPFNVAWHLQGFGCHPLFVSRVGDDAPGRAVRAAMSSWGLDDSGLQTDSTHPTGKVEIQMSGTEHSFNILPDQAYDQIDMGESRAATMNVEAALFYHGSLAIRTEGVRRALEELLSSTPSPVFVDINLRDPWWRPEDLPPVFQRARWIKVNEEELGIIAQHFGLFVDDQERTARQLRERYDLEQLILTRGEQGALAFEASQDVVEVIPKQENAIVDTVGAGDAFSSVVLLGLLKGWPCRLTMERAQGFASRICQQRGATSPDPELYREMMQQWGESS